MATQTALRVLVVEDEFLISMMLEGWLADLGCEPVGPATSIDDALAMIGRDPIDAAILDVNIKGGETYPVAEALVAQGAPFAFSTGADPAEIQKRFPDARLLVKPYDFEAVKAVVAQWTARA
jgi:CheY-like chemotaxis protein